jgi:uncharacterized protein (UPF0276 family)
VPPQLGVGVLYTPTLADFVETDLDAFDYLEVIPDTFWTDNGAGTDPRYEELESWTDMLDGVVEHRPVVAHSVSFSLGSAGLFDEEHLRQLAGWCERYGFRWHSDHLSFARIAGHGDSHDHNAGFSFPVPYDHELLDLIAGRIESIQAAIPAPFLIENNVYFVSVPEQEMEEPEFLNRLTERTGCGLLLDLHNVYANSRNHGFDPLEFVEGLDLARVVEIHIAGGTEIDGMYADSHSGPCPEPVWDLLDAVVPRAPNLGGVTFEFHDSYFPRLGRDGVREQLDRARSTWDAHHGVAR